MVSLDPNEIDDFENALPDQAPAAPPAPAPDPSAPVSTPKPTPLNPIVAQYLQSKMDMGKAQQAANQNQLYAGMARAGGTLAHAISGASGPMDEAAYNELDKAAMAPVQGVKAQQDSALEDIKTKSALMDSEKAAEAHDPNSSQAKLVQQTIKKLYPGKYTDEQLATVAPDTMESLFKPLELDAKIKEQADAAKLRADTMKTNAETRATAAQAKVNDAQGKIYTELNNKIMTPRGNQNVQIAMQGLTSVQKAKELIAQYPDPNAMPQNQVQLLAEELGKIATGGVPSEYTVKGISGSTFQSEVQNFLAKVKGAPTGAQLGEFIKANSAYLNGLEQVNKKVISDYGKAIFNGYKNRLTPEQREQFQAENPGLFASRAPDSQPPGGGGGVKMMGPDGKVRLIPADQVQAATAAGGKVVQ